MKVFIITCLFVTSVCQAQSVRYPYPSNSIKLNIEDSLALMSYMDVKPDIPNGRSVLLLHGKNFNGYYWKDVIAFLKDAGYRVIVPDQIGWGKSDKPNLHYSFNLLAANTKNLLDKETAAKHGNYPALGRWMKSQIPGSVLVELPGIGHIPHIQSPDVFKGHVLKFLN